MAYSTEDDEAGMTDEMKIDHLSQALTEDEASLLMASLRHFRDTSAWAAGSPKTTVEIQRMLHLLAESI